MSNPSWYNLAPPSPKATGKKIGKIKIDDMIGGWGISAEQFCADLEAMGELDELHLEINTPGGSVNAGLTIYDAIANHPAALKRATVTGLAASMGSVILLAADERHMSPNARVMVHRVTGNASGTSDEMQKAAELAKKFEDRILDIYEERTGQNRDDLWDMMNSLVGTWMIGQEAVGKGFAHMVKKAVPVAPLKASWSNQFHFSHAALFDNTADSSANRSLDPDPMKMTDAQKARFRELCAMKKRTAAQNTEHAELQVLATAEGFDPSAKDEYEEKRASLKAANFSDAEIDATINALKAAAVENALQAKRTVLLEAGLDDVAINKILKEAEAATAEESLRASLKTAGLTDSQIEAAVKAKAKAKGKAKAKKAAVDPDEEEEEEEEEEENEEAEDRIAALLGKALAPVTAQLRVVALGLTAKGNAPIKGEAKPAGAGQVPQVTQEVFNAMTSAEKSAFSVSGGRILEAA